MVCGGFTHFLSPGVNFFQLSLFLVCSVVGRLRRPVGVCLFSAPRLRLVAELKLHSRCTAFHRSIFYYLVAELKLFCRYTAFHRTIFSYLVVEPKLFCRCTAFI